MAFEDLKALKKQTKTNDVQPIIEETSPHDSQLTGNFDHSASQDETAKQVNQSAHYMLDSPNNQAQKTQTVGANHYY